MCYRLAVHIGAAKTALALIEKAEMEITAYERSDTDSLLPPDQPPGSSLCTAIERFLQHRRVETESLVGVAIGIPGIVNQQNGQVISCPNLQYLNGAPLGPQVSETLGLAAYIENNTNLIALGEHSAGLGRGIEDLAVVFVDAGVGCGLILNGRLYTGADGAAGEFGHTKVVPNGRPCTCSSHGCLEMYCSAKALSLTAEEIFGPDKVNHSGRRFEGAQLLIEQAQSGHTDADRAITESFTYLGLALASLANLLNPRLIILGGMIVQAWSPAVDVVRRVVMSEVLAGVRQNLHIELSELQNYAGVLGGAALVTRSEATHR